MLRTRAKFNISIHTDIMPLKDTLLHQNDDYTTPSASGYELAIRLRSSVSVNLYFRSSIDRPRDHQITII